MTTATFKLPAGTTFEDLSKGPDSTEVRWRGEHIVTVTKENPVRVLPRASDPEVTGNMINAGTQALWLFGVGLSDEAVRAVYVAIHNGRKIKGD